jgi:predicted  nucleic acid-binding Zn-ribbon protein
MNQYVPAQKHPHSRMSRVEHSVGKALALTLGVSALGLLAACSSVSNLTNERVARSETSVQQAQQTVGKSEHGAMELQQARERLDAAKSALAQGQQQQAERSAAQAHLYAELAVAKSQSADARKAANEVLDSLNALRQETERTTPTQR